METEFRYWDSWNEEMTYSENNVSKFFEKYEKLKEGENNPILMQYTGLKDKNGTKIYKGDIFTHNGKNFVCNWSERFGYCFVETNSQLGNFHIDGIVMRKQNVRYYADIISYLKYIEVIGNIHQHKELLK